MKHDGRFDSVVRSWYAAGRRRDQRRSAVEALEPRRPVSRAAAWLAG